MYDFSTGYSWKLRIMTKDAHMDAEPATAEDTAIMLKAFGGKTTWTPKAVWVTFSDGKTYIGSTHDVPHSPQHLSNNNFNGHLCVHFPISIDKAKSIGRMPRAIRKPSTRAGRPPRNSNTDLPFIRRFADISRPGLNGRINKFNSSFICGKSYSPPFGGE